MVDTEMRSSPPFSKNLAFFPKKEGCPAILTLLLRHGAKVTSTDGHGVTPLGIAAEYGNAEALEILIQHGETQILKPCIMFVVYVFCWAGQLIVVPFLLPPPIHQGGT